VFVTAGRTPPPVSPPAGPQTGDWRPETSIAWRINAERLVLGGWSRAILLQLAHPLVAAGVAEHGTFRDGLLAPVTRLHHTVRAMLSLVFGDNAARERTLATIRAIHRRVHGRLRQATGKFAAGTPYSAEDPALVLWVHATLLESILFVYERLVSPLSAAERDAYCEETAAIALALGARDADIPRTWEALGGYMLATLNSGTIAVGVEAHQLAEAVLAPPIGRVAWPATRVNRLVTIGLLPAAVREQYGFTWSAGDERRLARVLRVVQHVRRSVPARLALWPEARRHGGRLGDASVPPMNR
jgi:uncharacterized protein (DUF2236 family)